MMMIEADIPNDEVDIRLLKKTINRHHLEIEEALRLMRLNFIDHFERDGNGNYYAYINKKGWYFVKWHKNFCKGFENE